MASPVPAKSQPLHNFSLPHLKWKNHRSGRSRLAGETSSSSPPPPHRSPSTPWRESPPSTSHALVPPRRQSSPSYVSRRPSPLHKQSPMRDSESESDCAASKVIEISHKNFSENSTKFVDHNNNSKRKRSNKICIRFGKNSNSKHDDAVPDQNHSSTPVDNAVPAAAEEEESLPKTWNLRPRRPPMNHKQSNGGLPKIGSSPLQENRASHGSNANKEASELNINDNSNLGTSKKHKFSIALSRNEIEEDIFSLTGSKPSRRPKKRPRNVQKQLDTLFPGLWLGCITADSYKVSEAPPKG